MGVEHHLVEIGGELRGRGMKPNGQPWWVLVEPPVTASEPRDGDGSRFELLIALHGLSVATSGDYLRGFASGGRWYSHTIDPRSGYPVAHALASVTVLDRQCMVADAWSTALTVLGLETGLELAERRQMTALFVTRTATGLEPRATRALDALFLESV